MQDEGVERYGGTKDIADSHKFDEKNLEAYAAARVEGGIVLADERRVERCERDTSNGSG